MRNVLLAAKPPPCLEVRSDLAAPFVSEVGAAIRRRHLTRWATRIDLAQAQATEPAFDLAGGSAYLTLRDEMESAQSAYFSAWRDQHSGRFQALESLTSLGNRMERLQASFHATRLRHGHAVKEARRVAAEVFWSAQDQSAIPDTFFADEPVNSVLARMARIHPPWWGGFHGRLQATFAHGHPADGGLLDALPELRRQARKMTMEAMVGVWWQDNHARWGRFVKKEPHYPVLSQRAEKKAGELACWFDAIAPGFLTDQARRVALHAELAELLGEADPWPMSAVGGAAQLPWGEHGPN